MSESPLGKEHNCSHWKKSVFFSCNNQVWFGLVCWEFNVSLSQLRTCWVRPCQPEKLIPLLPWPGFDPSFSGHNDRRAIISEWTRLRLRPLSHQGWLFSCISDYLDYAYIYNMYMYDNSVPDGFIAISLTSCPKKYEKTQHVISKKVFGGGYWMSVLHPPSICLYRQ